MFFFKNGSLINSFLPFSVSLVFVWSVLFLPEYSCNSFSSENQRFNKFQLVFILNRVLQKTAPLIGRKLDAAKAYFFPSSFLFVLDSNSSIFNKITESFITLNSLILFTIFHFFAIQVQTYTSISKTIHQHCGSLYFIPTGDPSIPSHLSMTCNIEVR